MARITVPKDPTPTPKPTASTNPGSRWGSAGNTTGGNTTTGSTATGNTGYGNVAVTGFGETGTRVTNAGTSFAQRESYVGDALFNTASDLKALFVQLDYNQDPRLTQWMNAMGITDKKVAQKVWNDAADYSFKVAKAGKQVNFFDVMTSKSFQDNGLDLSKFTGSGSSGSTKYISETDKIDSDALLMKTMKDMLDRDPTKAEYNEFFKQLRKNENKYFKTVYYQNGMQKTTGAEFDKTAFVNQYVLNKVNFSKDLEGTAGYVQDVVKQTIHDNGLTGYVSDSVSRKWMAGLAAGTMTKEQLASNVRSQAMQVYKPFSKMMEENPTMSLSDVAGSYLSAYSKTLEVDPTQMDIKDALAKAVKADPAGESVMSLFDYEKTLKKDPRYQYTKAAANTAENLAYSFAKAFGVNI